MRVPLYPADASVKTANAKQQASACKERVTYECLDPGQLQRVKTVICSTYQGCREHDDCLDRCTQSRAESFDCEAYCHSEAGAAYGLPNATSWACGGGPFAGPPINFQYTRDAPDAPDPTFSCPDGAQLQCTGGKGPCFAATAGAAACIMIGHPATDRRGPGCECIQGKT